MGLRQTEHYIHLRACHTLALPHDNAEENRFSGG